MQKQKLVVQDILGVTTNKKIEATAEPGIIPKLKIDPVGEKESEIQPEAMPIVTVDYYPGDIIANDDEDDDDDESPKVLLETNFPEIEDNSHHTILFPAYSPQQQQQQQFHRVESSPQFRSEDLSRKKCRFISK